MTEQEQVDALWTVQGRDHAIEGELVEAHVSRIEAFQGGGIHASDVFEVILETGRVAYFKPANGLLNPVGTRALRNYAHSPVSTVISECAAWQLAKRLGAPWDELVVPSALRFITLPHGEREVGSLTVYRPGKDRQRGFLDQVADQAAAGAFFDTIVGQQDRNEGNVLWYEDRNRIYLIDHGFSFGRPGANSGEVVLTAWRRDRGSATLAQSEVQALGRARDSEWFDLPAFVTPDRVAAMAGRAERMLSTRSVLSPGVL